MVLSARGKYSYVPRFNGNRALPENEQVEVEIIRPKAEERSDLYSIDVEREMGLVDLEKKQAKAPFTFKNRYRVSAILRNHIGTIKNLAVEEAGKSRTIANGAELAESTAFGVSILVQELIAEVLNDKLSEDEKKSSSSALSSSLKDGTPKSGTQTSTKNGKSSPSDTLNGGSSETT
ncbi:MAG: hypothetical protein LBQ14_07160 [Treponema sp.]|jgi:hypothetical protein|nr:hypothetical protein [Treponema sp.]